MTDDGYLSPYAKNEADANRHMCIVLLLAAALAILVWMAYIPNVFKVGEFTYNLTITILPIVVVLLLTPMLFYKSKHLYNPLFKYYVLFLFILSISILNIIMPKHGILGWAVCIALTGHYYNPRVCMIVFVTVITAMICCLYLGVFYGEYDSNLLSGQVDVLSGTIHNELLPDIYPDTPEGRQQYLDALALAGENRFNVILTAYLGGRLLFIILLFAGVMYLNKRTKTLLADEVNASNEVEKGKTELEVAKKIQMETLPKKNLSIKGIEIVAELKAAKEVGGDLYDYLEIDKDHFAFLIGDVSGKGVPAAMFMMKTITAFRDFAKVGKTPSQILNEINDSIKKGNSASMFVTCFLAILDKRNGDIVFANAGHNPVLIGSNGNYRYLKCNPGIMLGCFNKTFIVDEEVVLNPGESMTLYTDGVTEARNTDGDFYGDERLLNTMNGQVHESVIKLHDAIKHDLADFVGDAPQSDDITLLTVKYHANKDYFEERSFDAKIDNIPEMLEYIEVFGNEHGFPEDFRKQMVIVGDELLSNIIKYGYENNGGEILVRLSFDDESRGFVLTIIDHAKPFNQLEVENHAFEEGETDLRAGGLGLIIVNSIMEERSYEYRDGTNILTLKKHF